MLYDINEIKVLADRLYNIFNVPCLLIDEKSETKYMVPQADEYYMPNRFISYHISEYKSRKYPYGMPLLTKSGGLQFGLLKINDDLYLILGPVPIKNVSITGVTEAFNYKLTREEASKVFGIIRDLKAIETVRFANLLSSIVLAIYHENLLPVEILSYNQINYADRSIISKFQKANEYSLPSHFADGLSEFCKSLMLAIAEGNRTKLSDAWTSTNEILLISTYTADKALQMFFLPLSTLCCNASIIGGAPTVKAFEIYRRHLDNYNNYSVYQQMLEEFVNLTYECCDLVCFSSGPGKDPMPEICSEIEKYIGEHISEKLTADSISKALGISRRKLYYIFECNYNLTINEYIKKERLRRSAILLQSKQYSMATISDSLGFTNQSYFIKLFKSEYGCTPGEYVNQL